MERNELIRRAIPAAIYNVDFPTLGKRYSGKVREVYDQGDKLILIATDRVSAFDHVFSQPIPLKGRTLTQTAKFWFEKTKHIVQNHIIDYPHPNIAVVKKGKVWPVEMVIRGYNTGHLWRQYSKGARELCGVKLPDGLKENQKLAEPIITPTTKSDRDEDISREEIIKRGLVPKDVYEKMERITRELFKLGQEFSEKQNLILVDTKYEFADYNGELMLVDEVHTGDSSRYWLSSEYDERFRKGEKQRALDKEYLRQWCIEYGFTGKHDDAAKEGVETKGEPDFPEDVLVTASKRYIEAYEKITGQKLEITSKTSSIQEEMKRALIREGYLCWYQ